MPDRPAEDGLPGRLNQLAAKGAAHLKPWARKRAIEGAAPGFFAASLPLPALFLLAVALEIPSGRMLWPFNALGTLGLALAAPLALVAVRSWLAYRRQPADRPRSLALFDRQLGLQDRLQTADEFSRRAEATDFQRAAVADAEACAAKSLGAELEPVALAAPALRLGRARLGCAAGAVLAAGFLLSGYRLDLGAALASADSDPAAGEGLIAPEELAQQGQPNPPPSADDPAKAANRPLLAEASAGGEDSAQALPRSAEAGRQNASGDRFGATGGAATQSQSNRAQSAASGQKEASRQEGRPAAPPRKPGKARQRSVPVEEERNQSSSGIAGGQGSSSGSKSASSDKQAADNKAQRDEEYDDAYDDLEDEEDEEQQAASASRPMLDSRKAPVDRSLSPSGAGEGEENPDANGRSGPGGLKKTRGVAAMLLGVPLPDHLRGQPNPGRMKVQRERSEPEEKQSPVSIAAARGAIDGPLGPVAHQRLLPWMQALVRDYFLAERGEPLPSKESSAGKRQQASLAARQME